MRDDKVSDVPGSTYPPPRARQCIVVITIRLAIFLSFFHPAIFLTATVVDTVCHFCLCYFFF